MPVCSGLPPLRMDRNESGMCLSLLGKRLVLSLGVEFLGLKLGKSIIFSLMLLSSSSSEVDCDVSVPSFECRQLAKGSLMFIPVYHMKSSRRPFSLFLECSRLIGFLDKPLKVV